MELAIKYFKNHKIAIFLTVLIVVNLLVSSFYLKLQKLPLVRGDGVAYHNAMEFILGREGLGETTLVRILNCPLMLSFSIFVGFLIKNLYTGMLVVNLIFYFLIAYIFYLFVYEI